jgi:AraC-like DNA-binding protein
MEIQRVPWKQAIESGFQILRLSDLLSREKLPHTPNAPQRLDFHLIMLLTSGEGTHMIDFVDHKCGVGTLVHVGPDQVHSFHYGSDVEAWMLVFRPDVLSGDFYAPESNVFQFPSEYVWPVAIVLPEEDHRFGDNLFQLLSSQQSGPGQWHRGEVSRNLMLALTSFCYNVAIDRSANSKQVLPDPLFLSFMAELKQSFTGHREAKWYSERLGCSYRTLCRACESSAGKTPKELIDERVLTEARRLLAHSRTPVYGVADTLGFSESTNFVKFYQRLSGETPEAFRNKWQAVR